MFKIFDMSTGVADDEVERVELNVAAERIPSVQDYPALQLAEQQPQPAAIPLWRHGLPDVQEETAVVRLH